MKYEVFAPARVGLLGNPSDVYYDLGVQSKVLSFAFNNVGVTAHISEADKLEVSPETGGLLRATILRFFREKFPNKQPCFSLTYKSTIPRESGLGGSTAMVVAVLKALSQFYKLHVNKQELAELALKIEKDDLRITAGPQDRYIIVYGGLAYMDFSRQAYESNKVLFSLPLTDLPFFIVNTESPKSSGDIHAEGRKRFFQKPELQADIETLSSYAEQGYELLKKISTGRTELWTEFGKLMNANFQKRMEIYGTVSKTDKQAVEKALESGALGAKLAGSGGSVIMLDPTGKAHAELSKSYKVFKPNLFELK